MFAAYDNAFEEIRVDQTKYSSLEVCVARLKNLCAPPKDLPPSINHLTKLVTLNDDSYSFVIYGATSFSFWTKVSGTFEKVSDSTVRIQFTAQIYRSQIITFAVFGIPIFILFGGLFLISHLLLFLFFVFIPIIAFLFSSKQTITYRDKLIAQLSAL